MGSEIEKAGDQPNQLNTSEPSSLLPTLKEWEHHNACEHDHQTNPENGWVSPTPKRDAYNAAAEQALNKTNSSPAPSLNADERAKAATVKELIFKCSIDLQFAADDPYTASNKFDQDQESLKMIFSKLDPQVTDRIINAVNPDLGKYGFKLAQAGTGEIWVGERQPDNHFDASFPVKEINCDAVS